MRFALIAALLLPTAAQARCVEDVRTFAEMRLPAGSVVCVTPFRVHDAAVIFDAAWLNSMGCARTGVDATVTLVRDASPDRVQSAWEGRARLPNGTSRTVFVWPMNLQTMAGDRLCGTVRLW